MKRIALALLAVSAIGLTACDADYYPVNRDQVLAVNQDSDLSTKQANRACTRDFREVVRIEFAKNDHNTFALVTCR